MAEVPIQDQDHDEAAARPETPTPHRAGGGWQRLGSRKWLIAVFVISVANFAIGYFCATWWGRAKSAGIEREIDLGRFGFVADKKELAPITAADFSLHIALLEQVDDLARARLQTRRYRVRQDLEEMLRQAHGGDFEDPLLGELKRQMQEQLNETLGLRAIADVIITDLKMTENPTDVSNSTETADTVPWAEKPAG